METSFGLAAVLSSQSGTQLPQPIIILKFFSSIYLLFLFRHIFCCFYSPKSEDNHRARRSERLGEFPLLAPMSSRGHSRSLSGGRFASKPIIFIPQLEFIKECAFVIRVFTTFIKESDLVEWFDTIFRFGQLAQLLFLMAKDSPTVVYYFTHSVQHFASSRRNFLAPFIERISSFPLYIICQYFMLSS